MISPSIRKYLKTIGRKGGKARAKKMTCAARSSGARKAVISRWMQKRFGAENFKKLGIPGWEIVDAGLKDLVDGNLTSINALTVLELRPKLRFLGVPVPDVKKRSSNIRDLLYREMEEKHGDMAYARFSALLERVDSFCHALTSIGPVPKCSSHLQRRWYA